RASATSLNGLADSHRAVRTSVPPRGGRTRRRYHRDVARPCAILVVAAGLGLLAARAHADERARADQRARHGYELAQAGELNAAIREFKRALAIQPRAVYLCNIGLAYSELGRLHRAHWFLDQ